MLLVTDSLLSLVEQEVARQPPELGGALLGPVNYPAVTDFLLDTEGHTSSVVYVPSAGLSERVGRVEQHGELELKGVLHSHPGLDRLSSQDVLSFAGLLDLNPSMPFCVAPIVTQGLAARAPHELGVPSGKVSFFTVSRRRDGQANVRPAQPSVIPVQALAAELRAEFGASSWRVLGSTSSFGMPTVDAALLDTSVGDLFVACPLNYPRVPPIVLVTQNGQSCQVELPWALRGDPARRVAAGIRAAASTGGCAVPPRRPGRWPFLTSALRAAPTRCRLPQP